MLTAYSPLALGKVVTDPVLIEIGEAHGKSSVQVTLRWAIQHEPVAVIPKASSDAHRISNLDVFDFELTGEQMAAISGLDRRERIFDYDISPQWDD